jgi:hypothetical protein
MNSPVNTSRRRGALTPVETSLIGCGSLALVFVVCGSIAIYYAVKNAREGMSSDPKVIGQWLQKEVKCDPPKGYECIRGFQTNALGSPVGSILVATIGTKVEANEDVDPSVTTFLLTKAPFADQSRPQETGDRKETKTEDVIVSVSEKKVKAVRREVTQHKMRRIEYQVPLRKSLVFLAAGPADNFDLKSMEDFLGTMRLDQPFDLPTVVKEAPKEEKKKS